MFDPNEVIDSQETDQQDTDVFSDELVDNSDESVDNLDEFMEGIDGSADELVDETVDESIDETVDEEETTDEPAPMEGAFYDTVRSAFPDADLSTPEAFQEAAVNHIVALEDYRTKSRTANKVLNELYRDHKAYLKLSQDLADGLPESIAIARNFDLEKILNSQPDDDDYEAIEAAKAEFKTEKEAQEARVNEYYANQQASAAVLTEFAASSKMPEETATKFFNEIDQLLGQIATGQITPEFLTIMRKGMNYEKAQETARIAGRNEAIVAKKENRPKGDQVPHISGSGKAPVKPTQELDWASEAILSRT
jgi:hypothetical protein